MKVLDFGLAKMGPTVKADQATMTMTLTSKGETVGTLYSPKPSLTAAVQLLPPWRTNDSADQGESKEDSYEKVRELAIVDRSVSLRNPIPAWAHSRRAILIAASSSASRD